MFPSLIIVKNCNDLLTCEKNSPLKNPQWLLPKHHIENRWPAASLQLPVWPGSPTDHNDTLFVDVGTARGMQTTMYHRQMYFPLKMYIHIPFPNLPHAPSINFWFTFRFPSPFFFNILFSATESFSNKVAGNR